MGLSNLSVPAIDIVNRDSIPDITSKSAVYLNVKALSLNEGLEKINIWVNGVPVYPASLEKNKTISAKTFKPDLIYRL